MAVKTLTIRKEVYDTLNKIKKSGESFSDVILRLTKSKINLEDFFGIVKVSGEEREEIKEIRKKLGKGIEKRAK